MKAQTYYSNHLIAWKSIYFSTTEFVNVQTAEMVIADGHITGEAFGKLFYAHYNLAMNRRWELQSFEIEFQSDCTFTLSLRKSGKNEWINANDEILPNFEKCTDIDISLTPFTNTLPIKRLSLREGLSAEMDVIYADLPSSQLKLAKQRYSNLGNGSYKYENLNSGFTSTIEVDENGYVIDYPGLWHRLYPKEILVNE